VEANLGELGRLDFDERGVGDLGQAPGDLRLAASGWACDVMNKTRRRQSRCPCGDEIK
jgi:hypothetical protein|tara:strand:+ start:639 stop:812 length:174 start_codon:yes stop_codon:yes gene_type:complete